MNKVQRSRTRSCLADRVRPIGLRRSSCKDFQFRSVDSLTPHDSLRWVAWRCLPHRVSANSCTRRRKTEVGPLTASGVSGSWPSSGRRSNHEFDRNTLSATFFVMCSSIRPNWKQVRLRAMWAKNGEIISRFRCLPRSARSARRYCTPRRPQITAPNSTATPASLRGQWHLDERSRSQLPCALRAQGKGLKDQAEKLAEDGCDEARTRSCTHLLPKIDALTHRFSAKPNLDAAFQQFCGSLEACFAEVAYDHGDSSDGWPSNTP